MSELGNMGTLSFFEDATGHKAAIVVDMIPAKGTVRIGSAGYGLGMNRLLVIDRPPGGTAEADLAGDIFYSLYLPDPHLKDEIPPERMINARLLDWAGSQAGYNAARNKTAASIAPAADATRALWAFLTTDETISEALKMQEQASENQQQGQAAREKQKALETAAQAAAAAEDEQDPDPEETEQDPQQTGDDGEGDGSGQPQPGTGDGDPAAEPTAADYQAMAEQAGDEAKNFEAKAAAAAKRANEILDDAEDNMGTQAAVMAATRTAADKADDMASTMAGWGIGHSDPIMQDPARVQDLMREMEPYVREIAKMAGRMRGFALSGKREKVPQAPQATKIERTQDPTRILQTEAFNLTDPGSPGHMEATAAFLDGGLPGWVPTGEKEKDGNAVICSDISGSMWGDRDQLSKALALAIAQTKKADGRKAALISFGSRIIKTTTLDDPIHKLIEWAGTRKGGGTNFDVAMDAAIEFLGVTPQADIIFISDGQAPVSDETRIKWEAYKKATGARLFFIQVGRSGWQGIKDLADETQDIEDLTAGTAAAAARDLGRWIV